MATFSEIRDRVKVVGERAEGVTVVTKPGESAPNVAAGRAALTPSSACSSCDRLGRSASRLRHAQP